MDLYGKFIEFLELCCLLGFNENYAQVSYFSLYSGLGSSWSQFMTRSNGIWNWREKNGLIELAYKDGLSGFGMCHCHVN